VTCSGARYETHITNDFAARADDLSEQAIGCPASSALAKKKRRPAGDFGSGPATRRLAGESKQRELTTDFKQRKLLI
jgi:hypothetical protein